MTEIDILRDISSKFQGAGIDYMLTGSIALNYYAQPRNTRDIDVVINLTPEHVAEVVRVFRPEYYISPESVRESLAHQSIFNLIHQESIIKVDCIIRKDSEYRRTEFERRQKITLLDFTTFIVTQGGLDHFQVVLGQRFAFGITVARRQKPSGHSTRCRLSAAVDTPVTIGYIVERSIVMTDTPPEIERMVRDKMMARSGAERMIMGSEMFEDAKIMVCASFPPGLTESERKRRLFVRLYGDEVLARKVWPED